jgi:hypothetical protein
MNKRYQIFISSTYSDLKEERSKVMQAIMSMDCIPAGMELFPAIDEEQFNFIKKVIDDCDYYILIIGGRYGTISDDGISYTEKEYDYAISCQIPVITFLHKNIGQIPREKTETNLELMKKLQAFQEKVKKGRLVKFWSDASELTGMVAISLMQTIKTYPQTGWVRADMTISTESLQEINELRKQLAELEAYKAKIEKEKILNSSIKNLAGLDKIIEISDIAIHNNWVNRSKMEHSWKTEVTLQQIFEIISPKIMYPSVRETQVRTHLMNVLFNQATKSDKIEHKDLYIPRMNIGYLNTIKIQFIALGLIEIYVEKTEKGHTVSCWKLTEKGYSMMMKILTLKKE